MTNSGDDFTAPTGSLFRRELRALREPLRLAVHARSLRAAPMGSRSIMALPGFSTNDTALAPLRRYLSGRGHHVQGWGLGTNRGDVARNLPTVVTQVESHFLKNNRQPVTLIGWSLGGVFAREVARERPELVHEIITMATPIYGGPRYTVSADDYSDAELDEIEGQINERNPDLIEHTITAFYTKRDGAVDWRACIDDLNPNATMIEVDSTHVGITLDPTVWLRIASQLAD